MKKKSLILIFVFFVSLLTISVDKVNAASVCCEKSNGDYCVFTDIGACDTAYSSNLQRNYGFSQFSCSSVNYCQQVCCIDTGGVCSEGMTEVQCLDQGGTVRSEGCDNYLECQVGSCVIGGQCSTGVTNRECRLNADKFNVTYIFDPNINDLDECRDKYSTEEGCCITENGCVRTTSAVCEGDFKAGKLCSNTDFVGLCTNQKEFERRCGPDGEDVYWYDSEGQLENIVGVPYDGNIRTKQQSMGVVGDCDYVAGNTCGINERGDYSCVTIDCVSGNKFSIPRPIPSTGEVLNIEVDISNDLLGGKNIRKNGESWCFMSSYNWDQTSMDRGYYLGDQSLDSTGLVHQKYSAGSRHYIMSCNLGRVEPEFCSAFRETVCKENTVSGQTSAKCVENEADKCRSITSDSVCKNEDNREFCVLNTGGINECWPRPEYALGFEFWLDSNVNSQNERQCQSKCGKGVDVCDDDECWSLGDCTIEDRGMFGGGGSALAGCAVGAGIGGFGAHIPVVGGQFESGLLRLREIFGLVPDLVGPPAPSSPLREDVEITCNTDDDCNEGEKCLYQFGGCVKVS